MAANSDQAAGRPDRAHRRAGDRPGRRAQEVQRRAPDHPRRRSSLTYSTTAEQRPAVPVVHRRPHVPRRCGHHVPQAGRLHLGLQRVADPPAGPGRRAPDRHDRNFEQTRAAAPQNVGGDVKLATFNVLNFFPTTGEEFVASGLGTCTFFTDRDGNHDLATTRCNPQRSSWCCQRRQPGPPAGQDRLGHQHGRRRHRLPRGARELGQVRQAARLRDQRARDRPQRRRRRRHVGRGPVARRRPAAD